MALTDYRRGPGGRLFHTGVGGFGNGDAIVPRSWRCPELNTICAVRQMGYYRVAGTVYKITSKNSGRVYVGSTMKSMAVRMRGHESAFRTGRLSCSSSQVLADGDCSIEAVELVISLPRGCISREAEVAHIRNREYYHINRLKREGVDVVNAYIR